MKEWLIDGLIPDMNDKLSREIIEGINILLQIGYSEYDIMKLSIQELLDKVDEAKEKYK